MSVDLDRGHEGCIREAPSDETSLVRSLLRLCALLPIALTVALVACAHDATPPSGEVGEAGEDGEAGEVADASLAVRSGDGATRDASGTPEDSTTGDEPPWIADSGGDGPGRRDARDAGGDAPSEGGAEDGSPADGPPVDASGPACVPPDAGTDAPLGMNDVTMLLPVPPSGSPPVVASLEGPTGGPALVPRALFERLVVTPGISVDDKLRDYQIVAVRFDLCDRVDPGPCPVGVDGRLRLGLQAIEEGSPQDVSVHAFYTIPEAELPCVVGELRALAALADDAALPLTTSPGLAGPHGDAYLAQLRALVLRYATADNLQRFTTFTFDTSAANTWVFRGVERDGGGFGDISIPDIDASKQSIVTSGNGRDGLYDIRPVADVPAGFVKAARLGYFEHGRALERSTGAIAQILNPLTTGIASVACAACHTAPLLGVELAQAVDAGEATFAGWYTSTYPLDANVGLDYNFHMLGYAALTGEAVVSQRVANETAQVLTEIAQRYP